MNKPTKPSKKIEIENSKIFYFDFSSKKVSLKHFLDWIKKSLPKGSFDVTLELDEEPGYYDDEVCYGGPTNLVVGWKQIVINKNYDSDLKKYNKKLEKWNKSNDRLATTSSKS
jgi:hypothetical protein